MADISMATMPAGARAESGRTPAEPAYRAAFRGSASEYFGIWIVNVLLTIVTIGIYSAWPRSAACAISTATPR